MQRSCWSAVHAASRRVSLKSWRLFRLSFANLLTVRESVRFASELVIAVARFERRAWSWCTLENLAHRSRRCDEDKLTPLHAGTKHLERSVGKRSRFQFSSSGPENGFLSACSVRDGQILHIETFHLNVWSLARIVRASLRETRKMDIQTQSPATSDVQTWVNDGSPLPEWVRSHMTDGICPNGTFMMCTPVGSARVHVGNVIVGHLGQAWVRAPEEVPELVAGFSTSGPQGVTSIGPGKATQFGSKSKRKRGGERKMPFRPPHGLMPSIEWVHLEDLSVDPSYQRSIDNEGSRRLIASIAANFDWRLCSPLIVSRRSDGKKVIIDGQHRWAAATRRGDLL